MSFDDIRADRIKKLEKIKEAGKAAYPAKTTRNFSIAEAMRSFGKFSRAKKKVTLAGRVFAIRAHGGLIFCDFKDGSMGEKELRPLSLQAYLKKDILSDASFAAFEETADIGDFLEFTGRLFLTQRGEKSISVESWRILAKSFRPLPEKWHGMTDIEERFRKRYLDLLMNDEVREKFLMRTKIINEIRCLLEDKGYIEAETPILQPMAGGAMAQPFKTRHNALQMDFFLRIAPELYLKRLLIGGIPKVYELGRNFRNEGIDVTHNPEFTMLEFYEAYADAERMRGFVEDMMKALVKKILKKQSVTYEKKDISFAKKFGMISFWEVLKRYALVSNAEMATRDDLKLKARQFGIEVNEADSKDKIADNIFKKICRPKLIQPTFVVDYPLEISPLAKKKENDPSLADRFQLIMGGLEIANGFSELNDPADQKERFLKQQELRKAGDKEASEFDESFIEAMEYGMPPAVGVGIGIDRLVMFLTDTHNIKEVILFPTMRPR